MWKTDKMPDDQAIDAGAENIIVWAIVGRRVISEKAWYGHPELINHYFGDDPPRMNNSGYVLDNRIVAWIEPTIKQLDILWKVFGCLDVEYYESLTDGEYGRMPALD